MGNWFLELKKTDNSSDAVTMFCFHHAGGSAQFFIPFINAMDSNVNIVGIQLPGRWERISEACYQDMDRLTEDLHAEILKYIEQNNIDKFCFFGHSLGALVGFELIKSLAKKQQKLPICFFISSKTSPTYLSKQVRTSDLSGDDFEKALVGLYGYLPAVITQDSEMKKVFLDIAKRDMKLFEDYKTDNETINVPTLIMAGLSDSVISTEGLNAWQDLVVDKVTIYQYPGDHFYLFSNSKQQVVETLLENIKKLNI